MKKLTMLLALLMLLAATPALAGAVFPDVSLKGKLTEAQKTYLSVSDSPFKLSDIKADFVFVEVYSMYCPICQRDAPKVNEIYKKLALTGHDERIRFIGIGAGNTPFEVDFYRKKFLVEFPLFEDQEYVIHKAIGEVGTPTFYLVDLRNGSREILFFQEGEVKDTDGLYKTIMDTIGK